MSDDHGCGNPSECPRCQLADLRAKLSASEKRVAELEESLAQADAELELYHPDRSGGR